VRSGLPFLAAAVWVAAATVLVLLLQRLPHANLSLVYLIAVLIVAAREGFWPSVFASLLSFLLFNYLFTPPLLTLEVHSEGDIATLVFFLAVAALAGSLAAKMRAEMRKNQIAVRRTYTLISFNHRMAAAASEDAAMAILVESVEEALPCTVSAWAPAGDMRMGVRAQAGPRTDAPPGDEVALAWKTTSTVHRAGSWSFLPIATRTRRIGLLCVDWEPLQAEEQDLLIGFCKQTAVAVERLMLSRDMVDARAASDAEPFR